MNSKEFKIYCKNLLNYFFSLFTFSKKINIKKTKFISAEIIDGIFNNDEIRNNYNISKKKIDTLNLPELTGGINKGDQRALFYLTSYFKPFKILELGTHIGCSTINIASAMQVDTSNKMITVDFTDVNSDKEKIWLKYNSPSSPKENLYKLGLSNKVEFITSDTINFLTKCNLKFDFIFIDAGHDFLNVFKDLSLSINLLDNGGFLIIHDFYDYNHFKYNEIKMNGPYLAVKKLFKKNTDLKIYKINKLPWETKNNSKITSLAIIYKEK